MNDGIKSAYERALERLEDQGIERPRDEAFSKDQMAEMDQIRARATARIAELEILLKQGLASASDPTEREKREQEFRRERERIESKRDRELEKLRAQSE